MVFVVYFQLLSILAFATMTGVELTMKVHIVCKVNETSVEPPKKLDYTLTSKYPYK